MYNIIQITREKVQLQLGLPAGVHPNLFPRLSPGYTVSNLVQGSNTPITV